MRPIIKLLLLLFLAAGSFLHGTELPRYQVQIPVKVTAPQRAELQFLPLPAGKKAAFSCRWDDSALTHSRTAAVMKRYRYKGTFYLTDTGRKEFWQKVFPLLYSNGNSIGNHTKSHFELPQLTPHGIHHQIMQWKIELECRSNQTVTAFVHPYGKWHSRYFKDVPLLIGSSLRRAGLLGGADLSLQLPQWLGMEKTKFFTSNIIYPGDRNFSSVRFEQILAKYLKQSDPALHMTLGVHSTHSPAAFKNLESMLKKYSGNPDWWYCNENEYIAYKYMYHNAKVTDKKISGDTVVFTVELPFPELLGSDVPLWAKCGNKTFPIRHTRRLPLKIGKTGRGGKTPLFPGLQAKLLTPAPDKVKLQIKNDGEPLKDVTITLRTAPDFKVETETLRISGIDKTFRKVWQKKRKNLESSHGIRINAVQIDFSRGGKPFRLWVTREEKIAPPSPFAQLFCSAGTFTDAQIAKLSAPSVSLPEAFKKPRATPGYRSGINRLILKPALKKGDSLAAVWDFQGNGKPITVYGELPQYLWFNGKKLKTAGNRCELQPPRGKCRIIAVYPPGKRIIRTLTVFFKHSGSDKSR